MKKISTVLKQVSTVFLAGILFLTATLGTFGGNEAIANPVELPQSTTYDRGNYNNEISEPSTGKSYRPDAAIEDGSQVEPQGGLKGVADNIREKLNLDQPIYPGTKEFINDVQNEVEETVESAERAVGK